MNVRGQGAVVTGGGGGIGRALARMLAAAGARVVVNDRDPAGAKGVAAETGGWAAPADVSTGDGVLSVIAAAAAVSAKSTSTAQTPVSPPVRCGQPGRDVAASWDVYLMAHVRAARELLPGWLERGSGRLVVTASLPAARRLARRRIGDQARGGRAGEGSPPPRYHGLQVHCICPQGVRTSMLAGAGRAGDVTLQEAAIEPETVADASGTA